jgi:hypothetical protein
VQLLAERGAVVVRDILAKEAEAPCADEPAAEPDVDPLADRVAS